MGNLRYVLFVDNKIAEQMAHREMEVYEGAFVGKCELNGLYPLSPSEIAYYVKNVLEFEHSAIVESYMPYSKLGLFKQVRDTDIISVNKYITEGVYVPIRKSEGSCAFNSMVDLSKDELGWHHPMAGISYLRNKQCMSKKYYNKMMETLANSKGRVYVGYLENCFQDMLLPEEIIKQYNL